MRRLLVLVAFLMLAGGCNAEPSGWKYTEMVQNTQPPAECPGAPLKEPPTLAGIKAYGLEGPIFWTPGNAIKVNWTVEAPAPGDMELELRRVGTDEVLYRLKRTPGPSLVGFPEPGCWTLTLTRGGQSASTALHVEGARLVGFRTPSGDKVLGTGEMTLAAVQEAISHPQDYPKDRPSIALKLAWKTTATGTATDSPLVYFPSHEGQPSAIGLGKSLVTGDCRDSTVPVAGQISDKLAAQIEEALGGTATAEPGAANPWANLSGSCLPFGKP